MKAIYAEKNIPRILLIRALKTLWPGVIWSPLSHARVVELPDPPLPGPKWLRVRNRQCGIDATDLAFLYIDIDPGLAPVALPGIKGFYLGHESVGEVVEIGKSVTRFKVGDRVVMESRPYGSPNCLTQEIEPLCRHCAEGQVRLCENESMGKMPYGVGGGWGESYIAHEGELWAVPDDLSDDQAALIEPTAVALHAVLRKPLESGQIALVIGAGSIGLLVTQAIKTLYPGVRITVIARYPHQREAARQFGAEEIIEEGKSLYAQLAQFTDAKHYTAPLNRGMLLGGYDVVYNCVGSSKSITDGLRWARAGGTFVLAGFAFQFTSLDLSPTWYQEVDLIGAFLFGKETLNGQSIHTYDLAIELLQKGQLTPESLITHRFTFDEYRQAIATAADKRTGSIKVMFTY